VSPSERNPAEAIRRIRLYLKMHPRAVNVAAEIGFSGDFVSPDWPYRMYAIDRADLEIALALAEEKMEERE
jgi:hypothetical protein